MKLKENLDEIISWIEENKHKPLRIDDVAKRAGYSKWYLQRFFFAQKGVTMANYCRKRRLTLAALAVKYSSMSFADIASWFHYDSQQTLHREFSRNFGTTPRRIRNSSEMPWDFIFPYLYEVKDKSENNPIYCKAPVDKLYGIDLSYGVSISHLDRHCVQKRKKLWDEFMKNFHDVPDRIFCLTGPQIDNDILEVSHKYFPATASINHQSDFHSKLSEIEISPSQTYAVFSYEGHFSGVESFIRDIYNSEIPKHKITRVDDYDLEEFFLDGRSSFGDTNGNVVMKYYIPVAV